MKRENIFWLITAVVFTGLLLPVLVQRGMFLDGITYSSISRNLALGIGSFWNPHYTQTLYPNFHEHPALFFIIQSFFFRVLGEGIYTERIFTLLTALLSAWGLVLCWKIFCNNTEFRKHSWLVVLLWITTPIVFWSYRHNMIENLLSIFTIFAIYFIAKSIISHKIIYLLPGSLLIILAFLTKGPVGLFPVALPFIYLVSFKSSRSWRLFVQGVGLVATVAAGYYLIILLFPEVHQNIVSYFNQQLLPSLSNKREQYVGNRFAILNKLLSELILPLIIILSLVIGFWVKKRKIIFPFKQESLFFLLSALSASLPLMVTLKQRRYYLVPALGLFILSFCFFIVPVIYKYLNTISDKRLVLIRRISIVLLSGVLLYSVFRVGKFSRDEELLKDIYVLSDALPEETIISTSKETWTDWTLHAYLIREGKISLDCDHQQEYHIIEIGKDAEPSGNYIPVDLKLRKYTLFKRVAQP